MCLSAPLQTVFLFVIRGLITGAFQASYVYQCYLLHLLSFILFYSYRMLFLISEDTHQKYIPQRSDRRRLVYAQL